MALSPERVAAYGHRGSVNYCDDTEAPGQAA